MSPEEFQNTILMKTVHSEPQYFSSPPLSSSHSMDFSAFPATFDWRDRGVITPVKDQGQCGSCWAFSATEAIESAWIMAGYGNVSDVEMSPQQLVDCDLMDNKCAGGNPIRAYRFLQMFTTGLDSIASYPYTGTNGTCKVMQGKPVARIAGYSYIWGDETILQTALMNNGPLSICLDATEWQYYKGGVMQGQQCCPNNYCKEDHCVQLVGYNTTAEVPYWIVRNSWGTNWGMDGYIYLEMNENTCGITMDMSFPYVQPFPQ